MPYIPQDQRDGIENPQHWSQGQLNYRITQVVVDYLFLCGLSYDTCNEVLGALEAAKLEFYRRVVAPYENEKLKLNGDVYP